MEETPHLQTDATEVKDVQPQPLDAPASTGPGPEIVSNPAEPGMWITKQEYEHYQNINSGDRPELIRSKKTFFGPFKFIGIILALLGIMTLLEYSPLSNNIFPFVWLPPLLCFAYGLVLLVIEMYKRQRGADVKTHLLRNTLMVAAPIAVVVYIPISLIIFLILLSSGALGNVHI